MNPPFHGKSAERGAASAVSDDDRVGARSRVVEIPIEGTALGGTLVVPEAAKSIIVFVHGSGSSRRSPRNQIVARTLHVGGFGTLLFDLLTPQEETKDAATGYWRFDIELLSRRLILATEWLRRQPIAEGRGVGFFGASTGAAAAIVAAVELGSPVQAIVSRGGRPDLAAVALPRLTTPTLLIVGAEDEHVLQLNRRAYSIMTCPKELAIVARATHLFEEPGALEEVAALASGWFARHLGSARAG